MFGLPEHAIAGAALLLLSEAAMLAHVEPFWTWHTPFAWTGYILLVDGIVYKLRGSSWLTDNRREFVFLAIVSIPLWVVFEGYNLLIENWYYINLPENLHRSLLRLCMGIRHHLAGNFSDGGTRRSPPRLDRPIYSTLDYRLSTVDSRLR